MRKAAASLRQFTYPIDRGHCRKAQDGSEYPAATVSPGEGKDETIEPHHGQHKDQTRHIAPPLAEQTIKMSKWWFTSNLARYGDLAIRVPISKHATRKSATKATISIVCARHPICSGAS